MKEINNVKKTIEGRYPWNEDKHQDSEDKILNVGYKEHSELVNRK